MKRLVLAGITLGALLLTACQPKVAVDEVVAVPGGSYRNMGPAELHTAMEKKGFVFINVHTPFAGNIAGTDLSIPYDQIGQHLAELPTDKSTRIVLYCRSGHMSSIAAETLVKLGYINVWSLKGGMAAWEQAGYPIESP